MRYDRAEVAVPMKLTRSERLILANQCKILEALYPKEATLYAEHREILERGFASHYEEIAHLIAPDEKALTAEECREVVSILQMFDHLQVCFNKLQDKTGIDPSLLEFPGFDGNNEGSRRAYAKFYCRHDGGSFKGLRATRDFNSHHPSLGTYQRMLQEYDAIMQGQYHLLSQQEIQRVVHAGYPHA